MSLRKKLFGNIPDEPVTAEDISDALPKRITGKIIYLDEKEGWGFITSHELKFTRIYFHWTFLVQDTLHFLQLRKGMKVEFEPKEHAERGWRAIRVVVIDQNVEPDDIEEVENGE